MVLCWGRVYWVRVRPEGSPFDRLRVSGCWNWVVGGAERRLLGPSPQPASRGGGGRSLREEESGREEVALWVGVGVPLVCHVRWPSRRPLAPEGRAGPQRETRRQGDVFAG